MWWVWCFKVEMSEKLSILNIFKINVKLRDLSGYFERENTYYFHVV